MVHGDTREGKWRGNWWTEWVASTLHTTSEHGASSITTADAHTSAASSRLNWRPRQFKWSRLFRWKTEVWFLRVPSRFKRGLLIHLLLRVVSGTSLRTLDPSTWTHYSTSKQWELVTQWCCNPEHSQSYHCQHSSTLKNIDWFITLGYGTSQPCCT
jgi:hypothetical protein